MRAATRCLVEIAGPGDLVGYADFADADGGRSQLFEATALTNTCVALFTRHQIAEVLKGLEPEALLRIAEAINSMWSSVVYRYATFFGNVAAQTARDCSRRIGGAIRRARFAGNLLLPELAQEELAEMIGSSRPMVSKLLTEMTERGMLIREGRRHILIAAPKPADAAAAAVPREPSLHPAFEPAPAATRRVRADRRAVRATGRAGREYLARL